MGYAGGVRRCGTQVWGVHGGHAWGMHGACMGHARGMHGAWGMHMAMYHVTMYGTFVDRVVGVAQALGLLGVPGLLNGLGGCLWYKGGGAAISKGNARRGGLAESGYESGSGFERERGRVVRW